MYQHLHFLTPESYSIQANSCTVSGGGGGSGTIDDVQTLYDNNWLIINEQNNGANPGFDIQFNFIEVGRLYGVVFMGHHELPANHDVNLLIYDFVNTQDEVILNFKPSDYPNYRSIIYPHTVNTNQIDILGTAGNVRLTLQHPDNGNNSHKFNLYYVALLGRRFKET